MVITHYNPVELIRKKRDKKGLKKEEIQFLVNEFAKDRLPDYQMSAFLMAGFLNGFNDEEAAALTESMLHSGEVLDLSEIQGVKVDKHSTGGVGDKVSIILAPIVASAGVPVPMISGRGLGHTGGTLDKLESITGFNVNLDLKRYREVLAKHNMVLIGQTEDIAPADKRMYALRDVTATVECIPLIAGSIMSKKLAEGIDALVLDVKVGKGAFMKTVDQAEKLATRLVQIGESFDKETIGYITNMDQPLGTAIGNWLEIEESIRCLHGKGPDDLMEVTYLLSGTMIYLGKKASNINEGIEIAREMIDTGKAYHAFYKLVEEQEGDVRLLENPDLYKKANIEESFIAQKSGFITQMDAYQFGIASLELGAGRKTKEDKIDPTAGIVLHKKIGDTVKKGDKLASLYTSEKSKLDACLHTLIQSVTITETFEDNPTLIYSKVDKTGVQKYNY